MTRAIGVDIGGTNTAAALIENGAVITHDSRPTPAADGRAIVDIVVELVQPWLTDTVWAIGIAAAGFVSADRSTVIHAPNIAWRNEPLADQLAQRLGREVRLENDANAAAWAEFQYGAGRDVSDFLLITVGTGIGGGIIAGGALQRGVYGVAGEIGHLRFERDGLPCGCGQRGCWEQYASGTALRQFAEAAELDLAELSSTASGRDLLHTIGERIGEGAATLAAILDPQVIALGGGVIDRQPEILRAVTAGFESHLPAGHARPHAKIVSATLGNAAGVIGAAELALTDGRSWPH